MKKWLACLLAVALLSGMACIGSFAEDEVAEPEPAPAPVEEATKEAPSPEVKEAPKEAPKPEVKAETKEEPREESKAEVKQETKSEVKVEAKAESKEESKAETKPETKAESASEVRQESNAEVRAEADDTAPTGTDTEPSAPDSGNGGDDTPDTPDQGSDDTADDDNVGNDGDHSGNPGDGGTDSDANDGDSGNPGSNDDSGSGDDNDNGGEPGDDAPVTEVDPDTGETVDVSSPRTLQIQGWLIKLGYLSESQKTGEYDDATRSAVSRFQADNGLTVTGVCNSATYALLAQKAEGVPGGDTQETPEAPGESPEAGQPGEDPGEPGQNPETPGENPENPGQISGKGRFGGFGGFSGRRGGFSGRAGSAGMGDTEAEPQDDRLNGVTPGEALTSTHASGDRDTTPYGAMDVGADLAALNIESDAGEIYDYALTDGALTLTGGDRWTFSGAALRTLSKSGVRRLILTGSRKLVLDTNQRFTGAVYDGLRSRGYTDNTFEYDVAIADGSATITVTAGGGTYLLGADGALTPSEEQ